MSGSDERFEDALRGVSPLSPEDDLGPFVRDVRDAFPARPLLAQETHVEAVAEAARMISDRDPTPARKESHMRLPRLRSRAALIVAGLVVAMSSFGGLAAAGALPGDVQNGVANVVTTVGIDLPGGSDESEDDATEVETPDAEESEAPEAEETEAPEADDLGEDEQSGNQGQDQESEADDQGEDEQSGNQGDDQESAADDQGEDEQSGGQSQDDQGEQSDDQGEDEGGQD
jgi:hypothetical protein